MPRKGMRSVFFSPSRSPSPPHSSYSSSVSPSTHHRTMSDSMMEENIQIAESIIAEWDIEGGSSCRKFDTLFAGDRSEAKEFLRSVKRLKAAMHHLVSKDSSSALLVRAQRLMEKAMKRLQKEFYQILSANQNDLDPDSVSSRSSLSDLEDDSWKDEIRVADESVSELAMSDLKAIADSMISSGYGKECLVIYKILRKSIVDESLYYLGAERLITSKIKKMDWEVIEVKMKIWLKAIKIAVKTLFRREGILCDHVFSASNSIAESCFSEIVREAATTLFGFPEQVVKFKKLSPEKIFGVLELYDGFSELWPEIESTFSFESTSIVRIQAVNSLVKLGQAIRFMLTDFEAAIQKEASKSPVAGGGIHPMTRYVMNYVVFLTDYSGTLSDIIADWPQPELSHLPESYFSSPIISGENPASAISVRLAWLVLVLLCKLDGKADLYKDVSLSYLFLANNLNYVVSKVRGSNLSILLGDDWIVKHEAKVKQYAENYQRTGWSKVMSALPESGNISPEAARECLKSFNSDFQEAYLKQSSWVIPDPKLRDEIKVALANKILPAYRELYKKHRAMFRREVGAESVVRYAPDDLGNYLSDLFCGTGASANASPSPSSSSSSRSRLGRVR